MKEEICKGINNIQYKINLNPELSKKHNKVHVHETGDYKVTENSTSCNSIVFLVVDILAAALYIIAHSV